MTKNKLIKNTQNESVTESGFFGRIFDSLKRVWKKFSNLIKENWMPIVYGLIILVAIVMLVYALGYSTPWGRGHTNSAVSGIVNQARVANIQLVQATLILLVALLIGLGFGSHNRKKYYLSNYIIMAIIIASLVYVMYTFISSYNTLRPTFYHSLYEDAVTMGDRGWPRYFYATAGIRVYENGVDLGAMAAFEVGRVQLLNSLDFTIYVLIAGGVAFAGLIAIIVSRVLLIKEQKARVTYRQDIIAQADAKILEATDIVYNTKAPTATIVSEDLNLELVGQIQADNLELTKVDKLRYQNNKLSYNLILLSILTFLYALFTTINYTTGSGNTTDMMVRPDVYVALFISLGIIMLLLTFLTAEKVKTYIVNWNYIAFVLGGIHILSIFLVPLYLFNKQELPGKEYTIVIIFYVISATLAILGGVIGVIKTRALRNHLKEIGEL